MGSLFSSNLPWGIWTIWHYLPVLQKLIFLTLCVVCICSLWSGVAVLTSLRGLRRTSKDENSQQKVIAALRNRCAGLRQIITATFYLFGLALFLGLQFAYVWIEHSSRSGTSIVLENFAIYFAFAANAFFVFLILHVVQWFVSSRVESLALR